MPDYEQVSLQKSVEFTGLRATDHNTFNFYVSIARYS